MINHHLPKRRGPPGRLLFHAVWAGLFFMLLAATTVAEPGQNNSLSKAAAVISRLQSALISASSTHQTGTLAQRYEFLAPVIADTHDLPYIGRFTMRRYWNDFSEQQQAEFIAEFSRMSIATYANRFADVTNETFAISATQETTRGHIEVIGTLRQDNGELLGIIYVLHESAGSWRIINILVDGVSDLALKRTEYQPIYTTKGFPGLIDLLSAQTVQFMQIPATGSD